MSEQLTSELLSLIGDDAFVRLTQTFGGRRLYIPRAIPADHDIAKALGKAAQRLSSRYAPSTIRVPLAREVRARHYRAGGKSNGQIASLLGMTETGIDKLFQRMDQPPVKGSAQLSLFPSE